MNCRPKFALSAPITPLDPSLRLSLLWGALLIAGNLGTAIAQTPTLDPPPKQTSPAAAEIPLPAEKTTEPAEAPDFVGPPLPPALMPDPLPLPDTQLVLLPANPASMRKVPPLAVHQRPMNEELLREGEEIDPITLRPKPKPFTYVVPGFYGTAPQYFVSGEGPLAGPKFRANARLGIGYDSNVNRATKNGGESKIKSASSIFAAEASYRSAERMRLILIESSLGGEYFWKPGQLNYNLDLGLTYQRTFVSPATLSGNLRLAYLSQPDYSQVNISTPSVNEKEGDNSYVLFDGKVDYNYRWSPQFSTRTTLAGNSILYQGSREEDNFLSLTLGNEFRFRTGRFTYIGEIRYESLDYLNAQDRNFTTIALLAGVEWHLGKWIFVSTRLGESFRSFETGDDATAPHAEFAINFRPDAQNSFYLNSRFGMEANSGAGDDSQIIRFGIGYRRVISSRMSASIAAGYIRTETQGDLSDFTSILDGSLSLQYQLSRRISLSTALAATRSTSSTGDSDYDQYRATFSASFEF